MKHTFAKVESTEIPPFFSIKQMVTDNMRLTNQQTMKHTRSNGSADNQRYADKAEEAELIVSTFDNSQSSKCPKAPFRSSGFGILLLTKGSLQIKVNFVEHMLKHRDILCIVPDQIYEIPEEPNASVIYTYFSKQYLFRNGIFFNIADKYKIFDEKEFLKFSLTKKEYELMHSHMLSLQTRLSIPKNTRYFQDIIHNSFLSVIYDIFLINEKQKKIKIAPISSKTELANRFLSLVSERFKTEKRVIYYANCLRLTPRHLSQVVKQVTGRSAGKHIDEFVIREAKMLLSGHVKNISEIAEELCFSNPSFFGKFFKKHTGLSPLSFKKDNILAI
ncbi:AraC family transcriptional regulator [Pedobacter chinensis]|uniref:AraC family transcriptional regulator n=1 Tax=Pedobacter chinensis TaxID=2282421 RepID=A0A369PT58_9SPHI|nr:helix-turn-helix domain-containing protein [Pedobacter chinensis]RDC55841.1 AraC family transcriptional regulator [Pedobacter chinensis]